MNKGLTAAEGERIAWEALVRAARGRNAEEVPSVRNSTAISSLKAELAKLEGELCFPGKGVQVRLSAAGQRQDAHGRDPPAPER